MKSRFRSVIFDFDYTLADSSAGVIECINHALTGMGLPPAPAEDIRRTIGVPLSEAFTRLAGERHAGRRAEFIGLFRKRSAEVMVDSTTVFDTVHGAVSMLKRGGISCGIVSTKHRLHIRPVLERENLLELFDIIVGGEDVSEYKPDPQGLLSAVNELGNGPADSLYVGDSRVDAETAMRAKTPFVAVLTGVTPAEHFNAYPVHRIIEGLPELPDLVGCGG